MVSPSAALREFHEFFGLPARDELTEIQGDELALRVRLIDEEYEELDDELAFLAQNVGDLANVYKELADLVYVAYGLDQHLGSKLDEVFQEVHRSNMTKLWKCEVCEGAGEIADHPCYPCEGTGKVVKYREDGKVMKPPTYEPPDIYKVITR